MKTDMVKEILTIPKVYTCANWMKNELNIEVVKNSVYTKNL